MNSISRQPSHSARRRRAWRAVFIFYALVLVVLTHWPRLQVNGPFQRTDLVLHAGAFALWTVLIIGCAWFGRALSLRNIAVSGLAALVCAGVDEWAQSIPALGRTAAWEDFRADGYGIAGAIAAALVLRLLRRRKGK